jgi:hypothetical protein
MNEYPLAMEEIVTWLHAKEQSLPDLGVKLRDMRERHDRMPAVAADFDAGFATGRINAWVSGEIDLEVLRSKDGENVFFGHVRVSKMDEPLLEEAYSDFVRIMVKHRA